MQIKRKPNRMSPAFAPVELELWTDREYYDWSEYNSENYEEGRQNFVNGNIDAGSTYVMPLRPAARRPGSVPIYATSPILDFSRSTGISRMQTITTDSTVPFNKEYQKYNFRIFNAKVTSSEGAILDGKGYVRFPISYVEVENGVTRYKVNREMKLPVDTYNAGTPNELQVPLTASIQLHNTVNIGNWNGIFPMDWRIDTRRVAGVVQGYLPGTTANGMGGVRVPMSVGALGTTDMAIEFLVSKFDNDNPRQNIITKQGSTSSTAFYLSLEHGRYFNFVDQDGDDHIFMDGELQDDVPYHFVINYQYRTRTWTIYVNGKERVSFNSRSTLSSTNSNIVFGSDYIADDNYKYFDGIIYHLRIFRRALIEAEISDMYADGKPYDYILPIMLYDDFSNVPSAGFRGCTLEILPQNSFIDSVTGNAPAFVNGALNASFLDPETLEDYEQLTVQLEVQVSNMMIKYAETGSDDMTFNLSPRDYLLLYPDRPDDETIPDLVLETQLGNATLHRLAYNGRAIYDMSGMLKHTFPRPSTHPEYSFTEPAYELTSRYSVRTVNSATDYILYNYIVYNGTRQLGYSLLTPYTPYFATNCYEVITPNDGYYFSKEYKGVYYAGYPMQLLVVNPRYRCMTIYYNYPNGSEISNLNSSGRLLININNPNEAEKNSNAILFIEVTDNTFYSGNVPVVALQLEQACTPENPFYVRWINKDGGYDYYMFRKGALSTETTDRQNIQLFTPHDAENYNQKPYRLEVIKAIYAGSDSITPEDYEAIQYMTFSNKIEWYNEEIQNWQTLIFESSTIATWDVSTGLGSLEFKFQLPRVIKPF